MPRRARVGDTATAQDEQSGSVPGDRSPKRRKIRKGTHSCWACKRKKIRCTFSTAKGEPIDLDTLDNPSEALAGVVCDGCRRRGISCVSQELPETTALSAAASHSRVVDDRLGRLETLLETLLQKETRGNTESSSAAGTSSPRSGRSRSSLAVSRPRHTEQDLSDFTACCPLNNALGLDHIDGPADLGPDNLQENPDTDRVAQPEIATGNEGCTMAISQMGRSSQEATGDEQTTTYTTWFGHESGIGEEELPGTLPALAATGPCTPASNPSSRSAEAANSNQAATASTACTEPSPTGNCNSAASTDGPPTHTPDMPEYRMHHEYMSRYKMLAGTWPSPRDLEIILGALERPVRSGLHKVLVYTPFSAIAAAESPPISRESARSLLKLPPVGSHLVLIAQKLLYLASFLQHMHPMFDPDLKNLSIPHRELIQRIMCTTTSFVTGNDSLVGSFEGVQCLVMQGIIQSNQGNLRRAWLAFRRAMTMSQLMGLHRGLPTATMTMLDPSGAPPIMPQFIWSRILYADRYLSLMLGLPQGLPGDSHVQSTGSNRKLDGNGSVFGFGDAWHDLRKIEEAHAIIAGRIIERNEAWRSAEDDKLAREKWGMETDDTGDGADSSNESRDLDNDVGNPFSTQSIDLELQRASRSMPAQWWLTPSIGDGSASEGDGATSFMRTHQLIDQLFHYHLLTQLHLPYMLRRSSNIERPSHLPRGDGACHTTATEPPARAPGSAGSVDKYVYSKITCVSASREVLSRFLSLRANKEATFFCRSIDFFALLASMTLCLAHLDSHRNEQVLLQKQTPKDPDRDRMAANDFLAHQRLSDRGMMEQVLQSMGEMASINEDDVLSAKSAAFLRRMLDVEHNASLAVCASMGCAAAQIEMEQREAAARMSKMDGDLRVWVPFLGTIRINKEGILRVRGNKCSVKLPSEETPRQTSHDDRGAGVPKNSSQEDVFPSQASIVAPGARPAEAQPFDASAVSVATTTAASNGTHFAATYPTFTTGSVGAQNTLSGFGLQTPTWASGDAYIPNNNPDAANPYMFHTIGGLPDAPDTLVNSSSNNINAAAFGGFGNYGSDGYGNGSGGGYGNGSFSGVVQGDDWTLQGVDFAFFENLLMHGAMNSFTAGGADAADTSTAGTTTAAIAGNTDSKIETANGSSLDGGLPEDEAALTNSRRPGENMSWV